MQTILKVYRGDSESSSLLHIHTPWAPAVRVITSPYGTFVIIRKSHPFLYEDVVIFQDHEWAGGKSDGRSSFSTHVPDRCPFALHDLNRGTKQPCQEKPLLTFTSSLCVCKH